jgi:hypothetical protein
VGNFATIDVSAVHRHERANGWREAVQEGIVARGLENFARLLKNLSSDFSHQPFTKRVRFHSTE